MHSNHAHTIWTKPVLSKIQLAIGSEYGTTFGIYMSSEIFFRFGRGDLHVHQDAPKLDLFAKMERRGN